jgi:hypothetical protein
MISGQIKKTAPIEDASRKGRKYQGKATKLQPENLLGLDGAATVALVEEAVGEVLKGL